MKNKILLVLFLVSFAASIMLSVTNLSETCTIAESTCTLVEQSVYTKTFGIKNSYYGVGIFALLLLVTYSQIKNPKKMKRYIINLGVTIGAIVSLYFLYLQQFVLEAYCQYCVVVDVSMILAAIVLILTSKIRKRKLEKWIPQ